MNYFSGEITAFGSATSKKVMAKLFLQTTSTMKNAINKSVNTRLASIYRFNSMKNGLFLTCMKRVVLSLPTAGNFQYRALVWVDNRHQQLV
jgi:hypothetical protein